MLADIESASDSASSDIHDPIVNTPQGQARTWFFRAHVRLADGQTFTNVLDAREKRLKKSLGAALVISWARANAARLVSQDLDGVHLEGFVHALTHIRLGMLKRVLPGNCSTYAGEIIQVFFEEVKPGPGKDYTEHPTIKTFLDETSLDPLSSDKRFRVDYRESTEVYSVIVQAKNWFGRGEVRCPDHSQVEAIFRSEHVNHRQESTLGSASVISFACTAPSGPESAAANTVQVEVLVIGTSNIRRSTLESWLDPAIHPQIVQFEWSAVKTGRGKPYFRDPTVKQFLEESALDPTVSGKRPRVHLCGPSGASPKKVGRKPACRLPNRRCRPNCRRACLDILAHPDQVLASVFRARVHLVESNAAGSLRPHRRPSRARPRRPRKCATGQPARVLNVICLGEFDPCKSVGQLSDDIQAIIYSRIMFVWSWWCVLNLK